MFVRKNRNASGSISIQIIDKTKGKYKLIETIGCSKDKERVEYLYNLGLKRVKELSPSLFDFTKKQEEKLEFISLANNQVTPIGDEMFFGKIYDEIFTDDIFDTIDNIRYKEDKRYLFKSLVISRLLYPGSKLYLIDYLHYFKKQDINIEKIYRFLDNLYNDNIKQKIQEYIYRYSLKKPKATTIYMK